MRGRALKYPDAIDALSKVLADGRDKDSFGSPLAPSVVKKLDVAFSSVPASTWSSMLQRARNDRDDQCAAMPSMGSKLKPFLSELSARGRCSNFVLVETIDRALAKLPPSSKGALDLNRICSARGPSPAGAPGVQLEQMAVDAEAASSNGEGSDDDEGPDDPLVFKPPYILGDWENDGEDRRISIAILMPSGNLRTTGDHSVQVVRGGWALQVSVNWPRALTDLLYLHKAWLSDSFTKYHPRLLSFRGFLRRLRTKSTDTITSVFRIKLPFKVKDELSVVEKNTRHLRWVMSSEILLYITLEAPDSNFVQAPESVPSFMVA